MSENWNKIKNSRLVRNPWLFFAPFLVFYIVLVLYFPTNGNVGDEDRYIGFANNLLHGFYSPPAPDIDLAVGPGYSILLMPFVALGLPLIAMTILNAFLYYFSIILLVRSVQQLAGYKLGIIAGIFWACYFTQYDSMRFILPEIFSAFLTTLLIYALLKVFQPSNAKHRNKYLLLSGLLIGYMVLTKIIFAYVLLALLVGAALLWVLNRKSENFRKLVVVLAIGFAVITPYLIYTYSLTGKVYYLGTTAGNNLYWMSAPYKGEVGSWYPEYNIGKDSAAIAEHIPGAADTILRYHGKDLEVINQYRGVEKDEAFRKVAMRNIKEHPGRFLQNCISNIGRIVFNYPYSYTLQKPSTLMRLPLNGIIVVLMLICILPTLINWRRIPFVIRFLLFYTFIYLGGSVFGSAETRMFSVIVPALLVWILYVLQHSVRYKLKFEEGDR